MTVKVCDMIMGSGKTCAAITQMNEDTDSKYIFVTPYLKEAARIVKGCPDRNFKTPDNTDKSSKLQSLHHLLRKKENIACTHALFGYYNDLTIRLIKNGGYKLIMDESFYSMHQIEISSKDLNMLKRNMIAVDSDDKVRWIKENYTGRFEDFKSMCDSDSVYLYKDRFVVWSAPVAVYYAFKEVTILSYMFKAQVQRYYFDFYGIDVQYIGVKKENGVYRFCDEITAPDFVKDIPEKVHIVEGKVNDIGTDTHALSSSWFQRAKSEKGQPLLRKLRNNLANFYLRKFDDTSVSRVLWTSFLSYKDDLKGRGYTRGFLSCNSRATNMYRTRDRLAYCLNIYYNPMFKGYLMSHGIEVDDDAYALSEMVQWIWRSAIRDGKDIWIYIPSRRMRGLLKQWLASLSGTSSPEEQI